MGLSRVLGRIFASRWVAGPDMRDAIVLSKKLNSLGISTQINRLGEWFTNRADVDKSVRGYIRLIKNIKTAGIKADASLKLSEIGSAIDFDTAEDNFGEICRYARKLGVFVWIDMEESRLVSDTIQIYKKFLKYGNCGICIQSYLKRSFTDVKDIVRRGGVIRLVKGAYSEAEDTSYVEPMRTKNFLKLMRYLFEHSKKFMVATHDTAMVESAIELNKQFKKEVTYAMLLGIRNKLAIELAKRGEKVSIYVPFGERWAAYAYRRLREASHLKLMIKSLVSEPFSKFEFPE